MSSSVQSDAPLSSVEFRIAEPERAADVERKQAHVTDWLRSRQYDGLLLINPANFAWFTSGARCPELSPSEPNAALFITPESRVVATNNVDSGQLFETELPGLGFLLKERPWHEPRQQLIDDLCRGRRVACDGYWQGTKDEAARVAALRLPLEKLECDRLRILGRSVAHAVEATARNFSLGWNEDDVAGQLSNRLVKHGVTPVRLQVVADGRSRLYPHWRSSQAVVKRWAIVSAVGSQWGLHAAATRVVCFGNPPDEVSRTHQYVAMIEATGIFFSQAGNIMATVWDKVRRIYEKCGSPLDWQLCDQGSITGYQVCESPIVPRSDVTLEAGIPLIWQPSIGPVSAGDTILISEHGTEMITPPQEWPRVNISVRGNMVEVPDLLIREPAPDVL